MPGSSSSTSGAAAAASLHEVLQFLGEYLAGGLCHRSNRIPILHQLCPQLGVAERVHRHLVSRASDRGPVRGSRPGLRNDARSATIVSRRRGTSLHRGRPGSAPGFISIDDRSSVARRLRARDARSSARSPARRSLAERSRARGRSHPGLTPAARSARPRLRRDAAAAFRAHRQPARLSFRTVRPGYCAACLPPSTKRFNSLGN